MKWGCGDWPIDDRGLVLLVHLPEDPMISKEYQRVKALSITLTFLFGLFGDISEIELCN